MVCMWPRAGSSPTWSGCWRKTFRDPANRRLAKHLRHEEPWLFTFLHCPGIEATNNAAERALRPAVVARKTWGGNRTENGAKTRTDSDQHPHHVPSTRQRLLRSDRETVLLADSDRTGPIPNSS